MNEYHIKFTESETIHRIIVSPNGKLICEIRGDTWLRRLIRQIRWMITRQIVP